MNDEMTEKYQKHYNQILSGTLTDNIMKAISLQANVKLANEILAEQENTIADLQGKLEELEKESNTKIQNVKQELESFKNSKQNSDNIRINSLESTVRTHLDTINRLNTEISNANKLKIEFENLKSQVNNVDTFRKELVKERENHENTKQYYENAIKDLNEQIDLLKTPPKRKKIVKKPDVLELTAFSEDNLENNNSTENTEEMIKDGGTF